MLNDIEVLTMMREIAIKRVKDNWIDEFSNLLDKVENKEFKKALSFYKENYFEGVSRFLVEPKTTGYEDLLQIMGLLIFMSILIEMLVLLLLTGMLRALGLY